MAAIEAAEPVAFGPRDATAAVALSAEAGWNQTQADWAMMLSLGRVLGFRDADGAPVASAAALPLGNRVGWISMVLVTRTRRRQGLATRLVEACVHWLESRGLVPVLDATPDGELVYAQMGFVRRRGLARWQRAAGDGEDRAGAGIRAADPADLPWITELDRTIFGGERAAILSDLIARPGATSLVAEDRSGFLLSRKGRLATQIGPLSAEREKTALALLDAGLARIEGPLILDAFDDQSPLGAYLGRRGFEVQRPFARMVRGEAAPFGDPARAFVAAGPELG